MVDWSSLKLSGSDEDQFAKAFAAVAQALPPDPRKRLDAIFDEYLGRGAAEYALEHMNNRTVAQIFEEYRPEEEVEPIASGETDGMRWELRSPPSHLARGDESWGSIKVWGSDVRRFSIALSPVFRALPPEPRKRLAEIHSRYYKQDGPELAYERMNGRTVAQILAEHPAKAEEPSPSTKADWGSTTLSGSDPEKLVDVVLDAYMAAPPEAKGPFFHVYQDYFNHGGAELLYERMNNRTIDQIIAEYEPDEELKQLAAHEIDDLPTARPRPPAAAATPEGAKTYGYDRSALIVTGDTFEEFAQHIDDILDILPRDMAVHLNLIKLDYCRKYGLEGVRLRMKDRTVAQILAEYPPDLAAKARLKGGESQPAQ